MDDLASSIAISASGLKAQSSRIRVISQNIANAQSSPRTPDEDPYRRKIIHFKNVFDERLNAEKVEIHRISRDPSDFTIKYEPNHPGADDDGYVKFPNVTSLVEFADMREANLSYQANLNVIRATRRMITQTLDLLKQQ